MSMNNGSCEHKYTLQWSESINGVNHMKDKIIRAARYECKKCEDWFKRLFWNAEDIIPKEWSFRIYNVELPGERGDR